MDSGIRAAAAVAAKIAKTGSVEETEECMIL